MTIATSSTWPKFVQSMMMIFLGLLGILAAWMLNRGERQSAGLDPPGEIGHFVDVTTITVGWPLDARAEYVVTETDLAGNVLARRAYVVTHLLHALVNWCVFPLFFLIGLRHAHTKLRSICHCKPQFGLGYLFRFVLIASTFAALFTNKRAVVLTHHAWSTLRDASTTLQIGGAVFAMFAIVGAAIVIERLICLVTWRAGVIKRVKRSHLTTNG